TEGKPPGGEHRLCQAIARSERVVLVFEQLASRKPVERQQSAGRQVWPDLWHADRLFIFEHMLIERGVFRLPAIVELFPQTRADLDRDLAGVDHRIEPFANCKE